MGVEPTPFRTFDSITGLSEIESQVGTSNFADPEGLSIDPAPSFETLEYMEPSSGLSTGVSARKGEDMIICVRGWGEVDNNGESTADFLYSSNGNNEF